MDMVEGVMAVDSEGTEEDMEVDTVVECSTVSVASEGAMVDATVVEVAMEQEEQVMWNLVLFKWRRRTLVLPSRA